MEERRLLMRKGNARDSRGVHVSMDGGGKTNSSPFGEINDKLDRLVELVTDLAERIGESNEIH